MAIACALFVNFCTACGPSFRDKKQSNTRVEMAIESLQQPSESNLGVAEDEAGKALELNPQNERAHFVLGLADYLRAVHTAVSLEQSDCLTGVDADGLREDMDRAFAAAELHFEKAVDIAEDYGDAWASRGLVAMQFENFADAEKHFEKALDSRRRLEQVGLTRAHLGWAHFHQDDMVAAARDLRRALQFQAKMCLANYRLGRVYYARSEWEKALERFGIVTSDPTCRLQESFLYHLKSLEKLSKTDDGGTGKQCVRLAPRSCVARECRSLGAKLAK